MFELTSLITGIRTTTLVEDQTKKGQHFVTYLFYSCIKQNPSTETKIMCFEFSAYNWIGSKHCNNLIDYLITNSLAGFNNRRRGSRVGQPCSDEM